MSIHQLVIAVSASLFFNHFYFFGQLRIVATWNSKPLELEQVYLTDSQDSISFTTLKMYLSEFKFQERETGQIKTIDTVVFYDLADSSTLTLLKEINLSNYESLTFTLGLDSTKNVSGELEHAYDPLLGMYWAWNTGYVNLKLAGKSKLVKTKTHDFEFHLGGYRFPFATAQTIQVDLNDQYIYFDLQKLLSESINLTKMHHIMLPGKDAFLISQGLPNCFY